MSTGLAQPLARRPHAVPPPARLCLNQTHHELRELSFGQRPAADDLVLRHLRTPREIGAVRSLRTQIDLSHNARDPLFEFHEKKETSWGWRSPSSLAASSSGRSARCRSATA